MQNFSLRNRTRSEFLGCGSRHKWYSRRSNKIQTTNRAQWCHLMSGPFLARSPDQSILISFKKACVFSNLFSPRQQRPAQIFQNLNTPRNFPLFRESAHGQKKLPTVSSFPWFNSDNHHPKTTTTKKQTKQFLLLIWLPLLFVFFRKNWGSQKK